jgi:hypothetical protein
MQMSCSIRPHFASALRKNICEGPELISRGAAMDESHGSDGHTSRLYAAAPRPRRTRLHIRTKVYLAAGLVTVVSVVVAIMLGLNGLYSTHDGSIRSSTPVHASQDHDVDDHLLPLLPPGYVPDTCAPAAAPEAALRQAPRRPTMMLAD